MSSDTTRDPGTRAGARNGKPAQAGDEFAALAGRLGPRLREIVEQISRLVELHAERARLRVRRRVLGIASVAVAGLVALALGLRAAWQFADGLAQALAEITGRAWLGEFLSGALLLGLVLGGAALWQGTLDRMELARRKRAHEARHGS
jgi:hypothetical protein